jgi:signal transduction histidine kinase
VLVGSVLVGTNLYRIAQEAVNNSLKHSGASRVRISLSEDAERYTLVVEDDGKGMPGTRTGPCGLGLQIMRYRAQVMGAALDVDSPRGRGVRISCVVRKDS